MVEWQAGEERRMMERGALERVLVMRYGLEELSPQSTARFAVEHLQRLTEERVLQIEREALGVLEKAVSQASGEGAR
jgi:DNA-directed RNA polymerase sigma subunit (sigma70/sigma32)